MCVIQKIYGYLQIEITLWRKIMKKLFSTINKDTSNQIILFIFIFSLVLLPSFYLPWFRFKFQVVDFFMPFFAGVIIYKKRFKNWNLLYVKNFLFLMGFILFSIILNKQWTAINDWFEIYKVIKYLLVFLIFKELYTSKMKTATIDIVFIGLLVFNFLHYHNIFNFNQLIMPLYCGEDRVHLTFFGLNSLGFPCVKRMIGTMGNPNDNAILFLIFMLFYLPKEKWKIKNLCFFVLCLIAFLACQSRTSLVAFFVIIIANFIIIRIKWQKTLLHSGLITVIILAFFYNHIILGSNFTIGSNSTVQKNYTTTLLDGTAFESNSWTFRIELWKEYLNQSLKRPMIGHAPQKNYFYEQKLHFENEYVLFLWRYGILGFIAFIGFYLIPIRKIFKTVRSSEISKNTLLLIMIFAICGLANVPLSNTTLSLLFFSYLGIFYSQKIENNENMAQNY